MWGNICALKYVVLFQFYNTCTYMHPLMCIWNVLQEFDSCGFIYSVLFKLLYFLQGLCYLHPIFTTVFYTISLCINIFWCLAQPRCRRYEVRYPVWFKTVTFSGRRVKIASNLAYS